MLQLVFILLMTTHLLAMNIACCGPLFCIWLRGLRRPTTELRNQLGQTLAWWSLTAFFVGMATGGLLLLATPTTGLTEALYRFPARTYWVAGSELLFTAIFLLAYAISWQKLRERRKMHALLSLLATSNLLYHFPPLMIVLGKLATNPQWTALESITRKDFLSLMFEGEVLSLSTHFALASIAVAALCLLTIYARQAPSEEQEIEPEPRLVRTVSITALLVTTLQLPVGIWVLATLSGQARNSLMGGDLTASLLLVGGMLMTFVFLQHLAGVALGDIQPQSLRRVSYLLVVLVLIMTATLRTTRLAEDKIHTPQQKESAAKESPPRLLNVG